MQSLYPSGLSLLRERFKTSREHFYFFENINLWNGL